MPHNDRPTVYGHCPAYFAHWYTRADLDYDDDSRAHELRAIASSWAYVNQVGLEDILDDASWRSAGVFQGSYLRDMASIGDGMASPIVAAQHVVCPRWQ